MEKTQAQSVMRRRFRGEVVSDKMDKTIVVRVDRAKLHSKYQMRFTRSRKYKVHDPENAFKVGDMVEFVECRPLSRSKRWRVVSQPTEAATA